MVANSGESWRDRSTPLEGTISEKKLISEGPRWVLVSEFYSCGAMPPNIDHSH